MAQGKKAWSASQKSAYADRWTKARKRDEERKAKSKGQNVAPGTFNGKSKDGYSLKPELVEARAKRKAAAATKHAKKVAA